MRSFKQQAVAAIKRWIHERNRSPFDDEGLRTCFVSESDTDSLYPIDRWAALLKPSIFDEYNQALSFFSLGLGKADSLLSTVGITSGEIDLLTRSDPCQKAIDLSDVSGVALSRSSIHPFKWKTIADFGQYSYDEHLDDKNDVLGRVIGNSKQSRLIDKYERFAAGNLSGTKKGFIYHQWCDRVVLNNTDASHRFAAFCYRSGIGDDAMNGSVQLPSSIVKLDQDVIANLHELFHTYVLVGRLDEIRMVDKVLQSVRRLPIASYSPFKNRNPISQTRVRLLIVPKRSTLLRVLDAVRNDLQRLTLADYVDSVPGTIAILNELIQADICVPLDEYVDMISDSWAQR